MPLNKLASLSSEHGRIVVDSHYRNEVFEVDSPHAFIQAVGYLKHLAGSRGNIVALRGQRKLYSSGLVPTLFRGVATDKARARREQEVSAILKKIRQEEQVLQRVRPLAREPLLQHYGVNTRWIDLVDNVWTALWFACHRARAVPGTARFLHFERRHPEAPDENHFAYILVLELPRGVENPNCRGRFESPSIAWIDLRVAVPSHFVRPHAQHGLLFRTLPSKGDSTNINCSDFVCGTVRVRLRDALNWIGDGQTLSVHSFFPPPLYDFGYLELLKKMPELHGNLGAILHIGA